MQRQSQYTGVNLYIKNLANDVEDAKLRADFSQYGEVTSAKVMKENGKSRGFGFVCFSSPQSASRAVAQTNGRIINGKPLYVALAQRKDDRRMQLEAQFAARKFGQQRPLPMYPDPRAAPPMFYPPQMVPYREPMVPQYNHYPINANGVRGNMMPPPYPLASPMNNILPPRRVPMKQNRGVLRSNVKNMTSSHMNMTSSHMNMTSSHMNMTSSHMNMTSSPMNMASSPITSIPPTPQNHRPLASPLSSPLASPLASPQAPKPIIEAGPEQKNNDR
eukprot:TRINITY_DN371_c0_g1_i1.p1 TRINITY_DN371_c0_g1~~TRINITY_DN371_c0_g1_i1.p1  ORF type:complete len:275 (-),score=31.10 TRINITY_DN371_c0_g1_i1:752-1576(-)